MISLTTLQLPPAPYEGEQVQIGGTRLSDNRGMVWEVTQRAHDILYSFFPPTDLKYPRPLIPHLVVDLDDRVLVPELDAAAHDAPELLRHLRIAPLDGVEVELRVVGPGGHGGGGPSAHPDAVAGPTDLDHQVGDLALSLGQVAVIDLADAAAVKR